MTVMISKQIRINHVCQGHGKIPGIHHEVAKKSGLKVNHNKTDLFMFYKHGMT
jgi:hypothetical protein